MSSFCKLQDLNQDVLLKTKDSIQDILSKYKICLRFWVGFPFEVEASRLEFLSKNEGFQVRTPSTRGDPSQEFLFKVQDLDQEFLLKAKDSSQDFLSNCKILGGISFSNKGFYTGIPLNNEEFQVGAPFKKEGL